MTTATAPPLTVPDVDVADMPAWDQPDERACELIGQDDRQQCRRPAAWMLACDAADCGHFRGPVLVCARCKCEISLALCLVMCPADGCLLACYVRSMERIR